MSQGSQRPPAERGTDAGGAPPPAPGHDHWLVRPRTVRGLCAAAAVALALTVVAELVVGGKGWPGQTAVFGFASCVVMVFGAKLLGLVLKRPEDYYGDA